MSTTPLLHKRTSKIPQYAESIRSYESTAIGASSNLNSSNKKNSRVNKLGTRDGVTLPTILNVLSIIMFLRFGFIIGQMGILGTILLLIISYIIDLLTTLSVSAIATNGIVKGGGAYYMLSRSLGVEFGGSIGIILYIGQILNSSLNVSGLIEPLMYNFGDEDGVILKILPGTYWWKFGYCTIILFLCIIISLIGSNAISKCGKWLCLILILSTISIPISTLIVGNFKTRYDIEYIGPSWEIFKNNLLPNFTKGAAGSQIKGRETFNDMFGIFFPATAGILAGTSMSGDLKNPSKSIPRGTLEGLIITFSFYFIVILSIGISVPRELLYLDVQILQTINFSPFIIIAGELSTSIFSIIVGIIGSAKLLEAIAKDEILPGLNFFQNEDKCILITWILGQIFLICNLNKIAIFITMAFLMTFIVTNMACALLKIGSAPNFRPSFKYFNTESALSGTILCFCAMFIVDGMSATSMIIFLSILILIIHFTSTPKLWGDVSQSLIYHQVRKYLFKLRQDNVKYWRPQILLLVDNPRSCWNLILFCNHLKKGGLYILGHIIKIEDEEFNNEIKEINESRDRWLKIRDLSKVKAFVHIAISPIIKWGVRNIYLGSGLGSMRPNITIIGFYDLKRLKNLPKCIEIESLDEEFNEQVPKEFGELPTDGKINNGIEINEWMEMIEDLNKLNSNIGVAKGFSKIRIDESSSGGEGEIGWIDLYPIDMISDEVNDNEDVKNTNFDTCTLILQMAGILHTVPYWKKKFKLRIIMVVEEEGEVEEERSRVMRLLEILRMQDSEIIVVCLRGSGNRFYEYFCGERTLVSLSVYDQEMLRELGVESCGGGGSGGGSGGGANGGWKRRMTMSRLAELGVDGGDGGDGGDGVGVDGVDVEPNMVLCDKTGVVPLPSHGARRSALAALPRRARCVVLSEVLGHVSGRSRLVFAALPAVEARRGGRGDGDGTTDAVAWAIDVSVWLRGVRAGACVLLHAKSVTVTGAL